MNAANCALAEGLVPASYVRQGQQALAAHQAQVRALLSSRRMPECGWDEATIQLLLQDCAMMDSNNFLGGVGVGEREARVACPLVARRHFGLAHGIGRSGDVAAVQPKAAGSSLLAKLAALLAGDAMRLAGLGDVLAPVLPLPLATGMALTACLLALVSARPAGARYVVWPRIDQKTCLKCITAANLTPVVVELRRGGGGAGGGPDDQLGTDVEAVEAAVERVGRDSVVAVLTTTSCFAPRAPDDVVAVARLCDRLGVPHLVNNAYGIQCASVAALLASACRKGRVDGIVQSTDKNFMVPVGGSIVAAPRARPALVEAVARAYPGRASAGAHMDLLATLLHWGAAGWKQVLAQREEVFQHLHQQLAATAEQLGERVLHTPGNPISLAMTLDTLQPLPARQEGGAGEGVTFLGSMLWQRFVSGTRVVDGTKTQMVAGLTFHSYGAHCEAYPHAYLTAAAALGTTRDDVNQFCARLVKCVQEYRKKSTRVPQPVAPHANGNGLAAAGATAEDAGSSSSSSRSSSSRQTEAEGVQEERMNGDSLTLAIGEQVLSNGAALAAVKPKSGGMTKSQ